jgi:hypothetical protein
MEMEQLSIGFKTSARVIAPQTAMTVGPRIGPSLAWEIAASDLSRCGSNVGAAPLIPATGLRHLTSTLRGSRDVGTRQFPISCGCHFPR